MKYFPVIVPTQLHNNIFLYLKAILLPLYNVQRVFLSLLQKAVMWGKICELKRRLQGFRFPESLTNHTITAFYGEMLCKITFLHVFKYYSQWKKFSIEML